MDLRAVLCKDRSYMELNQDCIQCCALVLSALNFRIVIHVLANPLKWKLYVPFGLTINNSVFFHRMCLHVSFDSQNK